MISVVIPAWNAAATLAETLASVAAQTRPADEVVVADDGSDDATADVARAAGARVVARSHGGTGAAMNAGVAASRFPLIAFLDSDDLWSPDKLALQEAALAADPGLDGVIGHVRCFADPGLRGALRVPEGDKPGWLAGALLIRRTSLDRIGRFDEELSVGSFIDWMHRAQRAGQRFAVLPPVVLHRRIRRGSMSNPSAGRDAGYLRMARAAILRRRGAEAG
jgi:glycosyltransferase involved in cell wall biosynthesis